MPPKYQTDQEEIKALRSIIKVMEYERANNWTRQASEEFTARKVLEEISKYINQQQENELGEIIAENKITLREFRIYITNKIDTRRTPL